MPRTSELRQADPITDTLDDAVPSISMRELRAPLTERTIDKVREACLETGFFSVEPDTGFEERLATTITAMREFFALPDDDVRKQATRNDAAGIGWIPRFTEPAYQPGTVSSLEAFDFGVDQAGADAAPGFWPELAGFRETASACWRDYAHLGDSLLQTLSAAAGLPTAFLSERCGTRELSTMRLLHYADVLDNLADNSVGIAAHTDFECITLLYQTAPGLELHTVDGRWVDAPVRGRIIVMLGDMLERWTNGHFQATGHRVRDTAEQRFSIVMFVAANDNVIIEPLESFVSKERPAKYPPVTQASHLEIEVRRARENAANTRR